MDSKVFLIVSAALVVAIQAQNYQPCTPFEWSTKSQECIRRESASYVHPNVLGRAGADSASNSYPFWNNYVPNIPTAQSLFDDNYFKDWRNNFDNWQRGFQSKLQENILQSQQRFQALEKQLKEQEKINRENGRTANPNGYHHSFQSSSFGDSSGAGESVISSSNNDGSWTIRSNALGISSSSNNNKMTITARIGEAESFESKIINDKELLIEVKYKGDSLTKWMSLKITGGELTVKNFEVTRPQSDTILIQTI